MRPDFCSIPRSRDISVDLWSVGVILYESLFGRAPFASESYQQLAEKIKKTKPIEMPASKYARGEGKTKGLTLTGKTRYQFVIVKARSDAKDGWPTRVS